MSWVGVASVISRLIELTLGHLRYRSRRTIGSRYGIVSWWSWRTLDGPPNKKALRVALTRCGTLSQNGYGTHEGALTGFPISRVKSKLKKISAGRLHGGPGPVAGVVVVCVLPRAVALAPELVLGIGKVPQY